MPRLRRRQKSRVGWNDNHRFALLHHDWFGIFVDDEHERAAWNDLKGELLPTWIAEKPGSRPRPWWLYDAPGEREVFGTKIKWTFGPGTPESERLPIQRAPQGWYGVRVPALESEERFLRRHDLLTVAEIQALDRMDETGDDGN